MVYLQTHFRHIKASFMEKGGFMVAENNFLGGGVSGKYSLFHGVSEKMIAFALFVTSGKSYSFSIKYAQLTADQMVCQMVQLL